MHKICENKLLRKIFIKKPIKNSKVDVLKLIKEIGVEYATIRILVKESSINAEMDSWYIR